MTDGSHILPELEELLAKQAITEVLHRYCRGVDRLDEDLVRDIYHDDAFDDHGYWSGRGHDFAPFVVNRLRQENAWTTHSITNALIEVRGDVAISESQVMVHLKRRNGGPVIVDVMGARYVDRFSKRNGVWKIDERTVVLDWHKVENWAGQEAQIPLELFTTGKRERTDAVYIMHEKMTLQEEG
ncbi:nuclear transport factor 2 family protein [Sphingobium cupriresistens]|uniref:Aromatic-ring-hydroxylating dioxygenase subunit beta n=1 Tax=Sphingobium cupriresistens LL01 TaxID=1420583 RepID=A0A0J7Y2V2_9SPHN|nr:nuclear transport factor 2 family protein [Sphingobium cupriresistens]KMS58276.1 aromatic-ring-hydroxylating dioxygenase subunit beta [Sphingobium cupriresistens LL01]